MSTPFKRCGCGRKFTRSGWYEIPMLGVQRTDDGRGQTFAAELRNCVCRSTLSLEHRTDNVELLVNGSRVSLESFIDANEDSPDLLSAVLQTKACATHDSGPRLLRENADLLEACEALVAGVEDSVLRFLDSHDLVLRADMEQVLHARIDRARAAITKARGES